MGRKEKKKEELIFIVNNPLKEKENVYCQQSLYHIQASII